MSKGFEELDNWVRGLESMEREMASGIEETFKKHETRYLSLAQRVSGQWMLLNVPDGISPEIWMERVGDFIELIFSRISGNAFEIFYQGRGEEDAPGKAGKAITYQDVLEWVKAGPEAGGKDKTQVEHTKNLSDEQIAYVVTYAINQYRFGFASKDYSGITERLEKWVDLGVLGDHLGDLLPAVLDAWFVALEPVLKADFDAWAEGVLSW